MNYCTLFSFIVLKDKETNPCAMTTFFHFSYRYEEGIRSPPRCKSHLSPLNSCQKLCESKFLQNHTLLGHFSLNHLPDKYYSFILERSAENSITTQELHPIAEEISFFHSYFSFRVLFLSPVGRLDEMSAK